MRPANSATLSRPGFEVLDRGRKVTEVATSLSIATPETLRRRVVRAKKDRGLITGPTTEELAGINALRKEVADQQRTIEILKAATARVCSSSTTVSQAVIVAGAASWLIARSEWVCGSHADTRKRARRSQQ